MLAGWERPAGFRSGPWGNSAFDLRDQTPGALRDDGQIGRSLRRTGALHDVECRDRAAKTLQLQVAEIFEPRDRIDHFCNTAANQDLPVLRFSTKPGGEVADRANRGVAGAL